MEDDDFVENFERTRRLRQGKVFLFLAMAGTAFLIWFCKAYFSGELEFLKMPIEPQSPWKNEPVERVHHNGVIAGGVALITALAYGWWHGLSLLSGNRPNSLENLARKHAPGLVENYEDGSTQGALSKLKKIEEKEQRKAEIESAIASTPPPPSPFWSENKPSNTEEKPNTDSPNTIESAPLYCFQCDKYYPDYKEKDGPGNCFKHPNEALIDIRTEEGRRTVFNRKERSQSGRSIRTQSLAAFLGASFGAAAAFFLGQRDGLGNIALILTSIYAAIASGFLTYTVAKYRLGRKELRRASEMEPHQDSSQHMPPAVKMREINFLMFNIYLGCFSTYSVVLLTLLETQFNQVWGPLQTKDAILQALANHPSFLLFLCFVVLLGLNLIVKLVSCLGRKVEISEMGLRFKTRYGLTTFCSWKELSQEATIILGYLHENDPPAPYRPLLTDEDIETMRSAPFWKYERAPPPIKCEAPPIEAGYVASVRVKHRSLGKRFSFKLQETGPSEIPGLAKGTYFLQRVHQGSPNPVDPSYTTQGHAYTWLLWAHQKTPLSFSYEILEAGIDTDTDTRLDQIQ